MLKNRIILDRKKTDPLYLQFVYQFINAVQRGFLKENERLPGSRIISKELKIHRKTVVAALEELNTQGWVKIEPNIGTFVLHPQKNDIGVTHQKKKIDENATFHFHRSYLLNSPYEESACELKINEGKPDFRIFNKNELFRFYRTALSRKNVVERIDNYNEFGNPFFKEQLSYYLNVTRKIHFPKENIVTVKSRELLLYVISQLLIHPNDTVLIGGYGYFYANMVFKQAGAKITSIPTDNKGINVDYIEENYKRGELRCVYLNSGNHYPTTATLSDERKQKLIRLAEELDFILLEDDTDFEFHYESEKRKTLTTYDSNKILYIGGLAQFLPAPFLSSFLIGPKDFLKEMEKYLHLLQPQGEIIIEQTLGEMIKEGNLFRYQKKAEKTYLSRRNLFTDVLQKDFADKIYFQPPTGGLAFWLQFNADFSLNKLASKCSQDGLFIPRICQYQNKNITALRLGFGNFNEQEMTKTLAILRKNIDFE